MRYEYFLAGLGLALWVNAGALANTLAPDAVLSSSLRVQLTLDSTIAAGSTDYAAPTVIGGRLYVADQTGQVLMQTDAGFASVLDTSNFPPGCTPADQRSVHAVAGRGSTAYVLMTSSTPVTGMPTTAPLPSDPIYSSNTAFQVIYQFDVGQDGGFSNPQAIAAFESRTRGHAGGGMLVLPDGQVALARGDFLGFDRDGLDAPQDVGSTVSKLLLIDPTNGDVTVAAQGLRNVQRLTFTDATETEIAFADIGSTVAEEINVISVSEVLDTDTVENFGWGRDAQGRSREGTFYVTAPDSGTPGAPATATGNAPIPETGYRQPFAQFGRDGSDGRFAVSGPVASDVSFTNIELLFGDLFSGRFYATVTGTGPTLNAVSHVELVDGSGSAMALADRTDGRVDPRFFTFADGQAGVLLEQTGELFRIIEIAPVPAPPSSALILLTGLSLVVLRRRQKDRAT